MKEYLLGVAGIVLFSSVLLAVLPNGKMNELIKNIARMACLLCILSPFVDLFIKNEKISSYFEESGIEMQLDFIQYSNEVRVSKAENLLKSEVQNIAPAVSDLAIIWSSVALKNESTLEEKIRIDEIIIFVSEQLSSNEIASIYSHLSSEYGCKNIQITMANYE